MNGRTVKQIAEATGRPAPKALELLRELEAAGVAREDADGTWRLTARWYARLKPFFAVAGVNP